MKRLNHLLRYGYLALGWLTVMGCQPQSSPTTRAPEITAVPNATQQSQDEQSQDEQAPGADPSSQNSTSPSSLVIANNDADATEPSVVESKSAAASVAAARSNPFARELKILAWNVESEGSDPATIARQLEAFRDVDIIALSEVLPTEFSRFGSGRQEIHSDTGNNDRLMIAFNPDRFELVRQINLDEINNGRHRSPLVAHLRERDGGFEFMVVNNHLARGNAEFRAEQALGLVEWARNSQIPIVAVGDYNFDYEFATKTGNEGFRAMLRDGIWKWVEPNEMLDSNYFDGDGDGKDDYPDSLLDFVFVAGSAMDWPIQCEVIVRDGDFPDDHQTSDHRPIMTTIGK